MDKPLISVLITTYNRESTIRECVDSVLSQTYENLQVIVMDDGSKDRTLDILSSITDSRMEVFHSEKNCHICSSTNKGFQKVKGEYLARIDSDDVWYVDKLEKQLAFLKDNPRYRICFTLINLIDEYGKNADQELSSLLGLFEQSLTGQTDALRHFFFNGNCLSHPSVLMETSLMREIGGFYPGYMQSHDYDYWIRIAKKYPIYVIQERLLAMRRFTGKCTAINNNSSEDVEHGVRFYNEYLHIKEHFFDDMEDALFIDTFSPYFRCGDSRTPLELDCEKAFLLLWEPLHCKGPIPSGVKRFYDLFDNPKANALLENKYHFTLKEFYQLTGRHIYFDRWQETALKEREAALRENEALLAQNKELAEKLTAAVAQNVSLSAAVRTYADSFCWKMTKPLRALLDALKK